MLLARHGGELVEQTSTGPVRAQMAETLRQAHAPAEVAQFYQDHDARLLWVQGTGVWPFWTRAGLKPEALPFAQAAEDALPASRADLAAALTAARSGQPRDLARAEVALSMALPRYIAALQPQEPAARLAFLDPALVLPSAPRQVLEQAAQAPSLAHSLALLEEVNPVYHALRQDLAAYHAAWSRLPQIQLSPGPTLTFGDSGARVQALRQRLGLPSTGQAQAQFDEMTEQAVREFQTAHGLGPSGDVDTATLAALNAGAAHYEQLIAANLQRARALPPLTARRYVLVNIPAQQLSYYEDGQLKGTMRIVVGTRQEQTPMMAGLLRYVVRNPYWNVPVDLVRTSLAPKVLRGGAGVLKAQHMEALSDWDETATLLDPQEIDWRAVANGQRELRVRQVPGGDNMMGAVKFMLPNELGIYLHDTPDKAAFQSNDRRLSAGCIRLERAGELLAWLAGDEAARSAPAGAEQRVDLTEATPVYITYLTAAPGPAGVTFHPDVYGRDPALLAAVGREHGLQIAAGRDGRSG
jgi:murein L,D-transpeptidase YcbB/YkuD